MAWDAVCGDPDPLGDFALADSRSTRRRGEPSQHDVDEAGLGTQLAVVQHAVWNGRVAGGAAQIRKVDGVVGVSTRTWLLCAWHSWHADSVLRLAVVADTATTQGPRACLRRTH